MDPQHRVPDEDQVHSLNQHLSEAEMDNILVGRGVRLDGLSQHDKARLLAGAVLPMSTISAAATAPAVERPLAPLRKATTSYFFRNPGNPEPVESMALATWEAPPQQPPQAPLQPLPAMDSLMEQAAPCTQTSVLKRRVQHLSAAVSQMAPLAAMAMGSGSVSSAVTSAAAASAAVVGGVMSSATTHEHHAQAQELSRQLQRLAFDQDRRLHLEAQELASRLHEADMSQDRQFHHEGL